jgi:hypothetical protein
MNAANADQENCKNRQKLKEKSHREARVIAGKGNVTPGKPKPGSLKDQWRVEPGADCRVLIANRFVFKWSRGQEEAKGVSRNQRGEGRFAGGAWDASAGEARGK